MFVSIEPAVALTAVVEMVSGEFRIFSGESVKLKCSVPDVHRSTWSYLWFRGPEQLPQTEEYLVLWSAQVKDSGKFYCQGVRDTVVGKKHTLPSRPVEITVDGKILWMALIPLWTLFLHLVLPSKVQGCDSGTFQAENENCFHHPFSLIFCFHHLTLTYVFYYATACL